MKTASAIFQSAVENVLTSEISHMIIYQDFNCLAATSRGKLKQKQKIERVKQVKNTGMTINTGKPKFDCDTI